MKARELRHFILLALAFAAVGATTGLRASGHAHEHEHAQEGAEDTTRHAPGHGQLRLDDGKPWATDAPLREGMARIRDAVALADAQAPLTAVPAAALAQAVEDQVAYLVANCKLEPAADATLHVLIARMLSAAAAVRRDPASADGLPRLREALDDYPRHFEHPGWPAGGI